MKGRQKTRFNEPIKRLNIESKMAHSLTSEPFINIIYRYYGFADNDKVIPEALL